MSGLLLALRTGTRDLHDALEADLDVVDRAADPSEYAALLSAFRDVYAPLERALDASPATPTVLDDWPARRKTAWLDADLVALGAPRSDSPVQVELPSREDVVGSAYVMEGATLGGAVVLAGLQRRWGRPLPHRFFSSYGADRGRMWRSFRRQVEALDDVDVDACVAAARRTFDAFAERCLQAAP